MRTVVDTLLVVILLLNFYILGTSRIRAAIRIVALQGILLGLMPLLLHGTVGIYVMLAAAVTIGLKGCILPAMLFRAMREVKIQREVEPIIGIIPSLTLGLLGTGFSLLFAQQLPLLVEHAESLFVPASLSTILVGFILLTTRRKAISQVIGYLVLENGIFIFGLLLAEPNLLLLEMGVLLDLFVCIFVMGIILNHINREFASLSTERLTALKEEV